MSYLVFALKYRPQRFDEVTGQNHVSRTLSNALKTGRAAQAYLFSGPRGVGKTSMARILAKALNCERGTPDEPCNECSACREITSGHAMDVIEIDGASNRGIDDIRELREAVRYSPAILQRKVYIIDEVHMLTTDAFNALLKTLEEPPRHVVFILATTEPLKVPQTILSRCQRFDFARLTANDAALRLRFICEREGLEAEDEALYLMARKGEGSMRDALTLLDQVVATGLRPLTASGVRDALGIASRELFFEWTGAIADRDPARALRSLGQAVDSGSNLQELADEFLNHLRNLLLVATDPSLTDLCEATDEERAIYGRQAAEMAPADLLRFCRLCLETVTQMRKSGYPRAHLEVALAEMCTLPTALDLRRFIEVARGKFGEEPAAEIARGTAARPVSGGTALSETALSGTTRETPARPRGTSARPLDAPAAGSEGKPVELPAKPAGAAPRPLGPGKRPRGAPEGSVGEAFGEDPAAGGDPTPVGVALGVALEEAGDIPSEPRSTPLSAELSTPLVAQLPDPWSSVLVAVAANKPALASFLAGSHAAGEEGKLLQIHVPGLNAFQKEQLERKANKQLLQELVEKSYGRPLGLKFRTSLEPGAPAARPGPEARKAPAAAASPERIQQIADLFDGDVIGPA